MVESQVYMDRSLVEYNAFAKSMARRAFGKREAYVVPVEIEMLAFG